MTTSSKKTAAENKMEPRHHRVIGRNRKFLTSPPTISTNISVQKYSFFDPNSCVFYLQFETFNTRDVCQNVLFPLTYVISVNQLIYREERLCPGVGTMLVWGLAS